MLYWYIQPLSHHENTAQRIAYLAEERGVTVINDDYVPFGGTDWKKVLPRFALGPVTLLASINAMKSCQRAFSPGSLPYELIVWCDWDKLLCSTYYAHWGEFLLAQQYGFYPLSEVIRLGKSGTLFDWYNQDGFIFVRPNTNDKVFDGQTLKQSHIQVWEYETQFSNAQPHLSCLVAKPSQIQSEYRLVVCDGNVIAASQYKQHGIFEMEEGCPQSGIDLAEKASRIWSPDEIFVMDLALSEGNFYILECGSVNLAGFYACKLEPIVDAILEKMRKYE